MRGRQRRFMAAQKIPWSRNCCISGFNVQVLKTVNHTSGKTTLSAVAWICDNQFDSVVESQTKFPQPEKGKANTEHYHQVSDSTSGKLKY